MKIFYDTEFIERGPSLPIELVSIGMVREDGETLYLINADVSLSALVRHPWLQMNAVPYLPINIGQDGFILSWDPEHPDYGRVRGLDAIAPEVREFCTAGETDTELWAYYGAYDHVVLAQTFGTMADYPAGMPMYTNDIMQLWHSLGGPSNVLLHGRSEGLWPEHNALWDAKWVKKAYEALIEYQMDHAQYGRAVNGLVIPTSSEDWTHVRAVGPWIEQSVGVIGHPAAGKTEVTNAAIEAATGQRPLPEPVEQDNPGGFN